MYKRLFLILTILLSINLVYSSNQVLDISLNEYVQESVSYNPLNSGSGIWHDLSEDQNTYDLFGELILTNSHLNETLYSIYLNFSDYSNIYNLTYQSGYKGYVNELNSSLSIFVSELPPNSSSVFNYKINTNTISPPINFSTSYSAIKVLTGRNITVYDKIGNYMDSGTYNNTCIYNITIQQNTQSVLEPDSTLANFTFIQASLAGADATNVNFPNDRTLNWNVKNKVCLNSSDETSINYLVNIPDISVQDSYKFINSTMSYKYNSTISNLKINKKSAILNIDPLLRKQFEGNFTNTQAIWKIYSKVSNPTNITINLKSVTLWVSTRNGAGSGFTNPRILDSDTINGDTLYKQYTPNSTLNSSSTSWDNDPQFWSFNYTLTSSPIVWMSLENEILDDGIQFGNRKIAYTNNKIYIKEVFVATGYWLELTKEITRLENDSYNIKILLKNIGPKKTPSNQVVVVYNFLPIEFSLISPFSYSLSSWHTTDTANKVLSEIDYNGTMYQFALMPANIYNSSLDRWPGSMNSNNSWSVEYNVSGSGQFRLEDLFLAGVDPLYVEGYGATSTLTIENSYDFGTDTWNYVLVTFVVVLGVLAYVF